MKVDAIYLTRSAELQNCYLTIKIQSDIIGMDQREIGTFFINNQQIHVDAFANRHNEITSVIFNSNTNVILGILGGCMIYVALYTTKNTHDEDIKDYAKAGK